MSGELDHERERFVQAGREALADIERVSAEAAAAVVRVIEKETGVSLAPPVGPSIMDATRAQLMAADLRARHAVAAMDVVLRGWSWGDARTLGELMRDPDLPQDVREHVADLLAEAGLS
ncbi:hypothetical protein [Streptomyces sp. NPDC001537]